MVCSKKFIFVLFFVFFMLFAFATTVRAEWTDGDIADCLNGLSFITDNQGVVISQLSSLGVNVSNIKNDLDSINSRLNEIKTDTSNIDSKLSTVITDIENLNTILTQLAQQQNIYYENMTEQIRTIRDALLGSDDTPVTLQYIDIVNGSSVSGYTPGLRKYKIPTLKNYTYIIKVTYKNNESYDITVGYILSSLNISNGGVISDSSLNYLGVVPSHSSSTFTIVAKDDTRPYLYLTYGYNDITISATGSIEGLIDVLDRTNNQVVENIQQGNQLQEQQNQLQQEQNNFLKDGNVSSDGSNLPSDNTQDITEDGFNSIFNKIYAAFTSNSSSSLVITIPFTGKSFTISANTVYGSANLGFVKTLIQAFWYFVISYFIVKDIGKKINKIKSGDIEHVQEDNIKEDML